MMKSHRSPEEAAHTERVQSTNVRLDRVGGKPFRRAS
jgi:hypothetical protein